jgi:type IV pilus assembly protein PilY1
VINASANDVNQDGTTLKSKEKTIWIGTGQNTNASFTGLRFNVAVPRNAIITSARLEFASPTNSWISIKFTMRSQASGNCTAYSTNSRPSQRTLTTPSVTHQSNQLWLADQYYALNDISPVIQAVVNRGDWTSGNNLCLILKGMGKQWGRKFVYSFDGNPALAPRLVITYVVP